MIEYRRRIAYVAASVCLLVLLAAGTVFGSQPDYGPLPVAVEVLRVPGTDGRVDLRVTVAEAIGCDSMTMVLETTGQLNPVGSDYGTFHLTKPETGGSASVYESIMRLEVAPDDTCTAVIRFVGSDLDPKYPTIYFITTGDTLEIYHGRPPMPWVRPEGGNRWHTSSDKVVVDTTRDRYTLDLRNVARFRALSQHDTVLAPNRPMTKPGVYILWLTHKQFLGLKRHGFQAWPVGEEPDSIQVPDSIDGGSSSLDPPGGLGRGATAVPASSLSRKSCGRGVVGL